MVNERETLIAKLKEALERVLRPMAEASDEPVSFLRSLEPELASALVTATLDGVDPVADIEIRSALAAALRTVVGQLCAEYARR